MYGRGQESSPGRGQARRQGNSPRGGQVSLGRGHGSPGHGQGNVQANQPTRYVLTHT